MTDIQHQLLQMIARVAQALGPELGERMAFVGGATTGLLLTCLLYTSRCV